MVRRRGEIPSPFTSELIFQFTAAHLYEWDEPKRSDRQPVRSVVDDDLLEPLLRGGPLDDWLDRRLSAASRIACGTSAGRRAPWTRWPNDCGSSAT